MLQIGISVLETHKNQPHFLLVYVRKVETGQTTVLQSRHFLWSMLSLPALLALNAWRVTP